MTTNVSGNYYPKYTTTNPIARTIMAGFLREFDGLVGQVNPKSVVEAGCGEGTLSLRLLDRGVSATGFDVGREVVDLANDTARARGFERPFRVASVHDLEPGSLVGVDLLVCCEVLEHLDEPSHALARIAESGPRYILTSVPREPAWRILNMLRFSYLGHFGNTPGHLNHWGSASFTRFVSRFAKVVEIRRPLPWTMVLCRP